MHHPTMRVASERIEATGENTARVHGHLSLLGVSRPVVLERLLMLQRPVHRPVLVQRP